jgi:N-acetylmuramoyl-L-alanine amidase
MCLVLAIVASLAQAVATGLPERALAVAAEVAVEGARTRLTLTLSKPVTAAAFLLEKPDRVVVELPEVNFQIGADSAKRRGGMISSLRCGLFAPGRSRIVLELAGPALVSKVEATEAGVAEASLLTIELTRTDRETFRRTAATDQADLTLTTGSLPAGPAKDNRPVIAIDAGHGGVDPGATAPNGVLEKDITFAFAAILRDKLSAAGRYRVMLTRDQDIFVPLDERVRRARDAGAELFVSIHADTISSPQVSGATIYTGSERATDGEAASLAERENAADQAGGLGGSSPGRGDRHPPGAHAAGDARLLPALLGLLLRDLSSVARVSAQPQREAGFRVLRTPDLPSVLVELGYLSNARDLDLMLSPEWRNRTAAAMASAVERFFSARLASRAAMSP